MRVILLFLSSLVCLCGYGVGIEPDNPLQEVVETAPDRHAVTIDTGKGGISGIMVTRESDDAINGCIVNEFGISALDFIYDRKKDKLKLTYVVSFLNKWYIKKVLAGDIRYCIRLLYGITEGKARHYRVEETDGITRVTNTKRKISYTFSPLTKRIDETGE